MINKIILLIILFTIPQLSFAQKDSAAAFNSIDLFAGLNININEGDLSEYWNPGKGISVNITTPFYAGTIGIGVDALFFNSKSNNQPDYKSFFINLSWMQGIKIYDPAELRLGVKFGSYNMLFAENNQSEFETNESELAIAAAGTLQIRLYKKLYLNICPELLTVFTNKRMKLFNISTGLSYSFDSPLWIKRILE